ncbi:MAG: MaoC family dehydratase [Dehalococcoidales bacterium]|nr:MaoC family dehydratase [Dehalococcoidales bacterium]
MFFEELNIGDKFNTRPRVVTGTEIDNFAVSTGLINPLFLDDKAARSRGFETRIAPGYLTLSLTVGAVYALGLLDHGLALLSITVNFTAPVQAGDEIRSTVEVVEKNETQNRGRGIVAFKIICQNQEGKQVFEVPKLVTLLLRSS